MLTALSDLGRVGTRVINASKDDTVANLRALEPILTQLAEAGDDLPNALEMLVTYPFPRSATGAVHGDFTNLRITADIDLRTILANLNGGKDPGLPTLPTLPPVPNPTLSVPGVPLPTVSVPGVRCPPCDPTAAERDAAGRRWRWRWPVCVPGVVCLNNASSRTPPPAPRHQPGPPDAGGAGMIRRGVKVQLGVFLVITIVGVSYVSARYVGLGKRSSAPATSSPPTSPSPAASSRTPRSPTAGWPSAGSASSGWPTTASTSTSGSTAASRCPKDTVAVVENRSAVGEQYVDLQPRTAGGPFLADGDRIDATATAPRCTPRSCCSTSTGW